MEFPLGRLEPTDLKHVKKYPLQLTGVPDTVERVLRLPYAYRPRYDQGSEGACVGFAWSWAVSIYNRKFYDARWLYKLAQREYDEWAGDSDGITGPKYEGTSVRAGGDALRLVGHKLLHRHTHEHQPDPAHGIERNEWATTVDQVRLCIATGNPVVVGVDWYSNFDRPQPERGQHWIGRGSLGSIRGGHAICCYGASDKRQAVKLVNSWGRRYPTVWLPYDVLQKLLSGDRWPGEAAIITDRIGQ